MPKRREQASSRGLLSFKPILLAWLQRSAGCQETQSPVGRYGESPTSPGALAALLTKEGVAGEREMKCKA